MLWTFQLNNAALLFLKMAAALGQSGQGLCKGSQASHIKHTSNGNGTAGILTFSHQSSYLNNSWINWPLEKKLRKKTKNVFFIKLVNLLRNIEGTHSNNMLWGKKATTILIGEFLWKETRIHSTSQYRHANYIKYFIKPEWFP